MAKGNVQFDDDLHVQSGGVAFSGFSLQAPASTVLAAAETFYKMQGTTVEILNPDGFSHTIPGRISYSGRTPRFFKIDAIASVASASNNFVVKICILKNGTRESFSVQSKNKSNANDILHVTTQTLVSARQNDYFEIAFACDNPNVTLDVQSASFIIMSL